MSISPGAPLSILVLAAAGIQRDALVSLLRAQPNMTVTVVTGDLTVAQSVALCQQANLIVIDGGLQTDAALSMVATLRQMRPLVRCVVLADSTAQRRAFLQVGAYDALLKGCLDAHLLAVLSK
jgi:DNA-binding NarL/FixJ family response regulator